MLDQLEELLGYSFQEKKLLQQALTHGSTASQTRRSGGGSALRSTSVSSYERLEFLGDRVLGLSVADLLYKIFPQEDEGRLAQRLALLCSRKTLEKVAVVWRVHQHLEGDSPDVGSKVLADCCEAILGAIHLDGGFSHAYNVVQKYWEPYVEASFQLDGKTLLQHLALGKGYPLPTYHLINKTGFDHDPTLTVEVRLLSHAEQAQGGNRKTAEQKAALQLFYKLSEFSDDH